MNVVSAIITKLDLKKSSHVAYAPVRGFVVKMPVLSKALNDVITNHLRNCLSFVSNHVF